MSNLRFGVKPKYGYKPESFDYLSTNHSRSQVVNENKIDAEDILFETILNLHEQGKISISHEEVLSESILGLIRTGVITVNTAKGLQSGKRLQQHSRELKSDANALRIAKDQEDLQKRTSDCLKTLADALLDLEELNRRVLYVSASSGLFSDRAFNLLKKMDKQNRRRR